METVNEFKITFWYYFKVLQKHIALKLECKKNYTSPRKLWKQRERTTMNKKNKSRNEQRASTV